MNLLKTFIEVKEDLDAMMSDLFLKHENKLGINDGGVYPDEETQLDEDLEEVAMTITRILKRQYEMEHGE